MHYIHIWSAILVQVLRMCRHMHKNCPFLQFAFWILVILGQALTHVSILCNNLFCAIAPIVQQFAEICDFVLKKSHSAPNIAGFLAVWFWEFFSLCWQHMGGFFCWVFFHTDSATCKDRTPPIRLWSGCNKLYMMASWLLWFFFWSTPLARESILHPVCGLLYQSN